VKKTDVRDMFKKTSKSVWTSNVVVPLDPLFPTPLTSSATKTPENTEEDPQGLPLNQQLNEIPKWNSPLISCAAQVHKK
jgi:hypothetical protein